MPRTSAVDQRMEQDKVEGHAHSAIVEFADQHSNAASALDTWYRILKGGTFLNFAELKATFPSVDLIKATVSVFNIGGNTARLVASIHFNTQRIFILAIFDACRV